jgi:hypothetical protein
VILTLASWPERWRALDRARRRGYVEEEAAIAGDLIRLDAIRRRRGCGSGVPAGEDSCYHDGVKITFERQ